MKLAGSEGEVDNIGDCGNKYVIASMHTSAFLLLRDAITINV